MALRKAVLLDADYTVKKGKTYVRLLLKGKKTFRLYDFYEPYFYADAPESEAEKIMQMAVEHNGEKITPLRVQAVQKNVFGKDKMLLKITCSSPSHVPHLSAKTPHPVYENNILFGRRYMIDKGLSPFCLLAYEREGKFIKKLLWAKEGTPKLNSLAFDIETYNPIGAPRPEKDPCIMISYANGSCGVLTYKKINKPFVVSKKSEAEIISSFCDVLRKNETDVLFGYNSSSFDLPYLQARSGALKIPLPIGRDGRSFLLRKAGMRDMAKIGGRIHIDLYPAIRFLSFIGALKASKFTLEAAYSEITGKQKYMVKRLEIHQMWDSSTDEVREELAHYSMQDAIATKELGAIVLPLLVEMSRLTKMPLFDTAYATAGQLVESLLIYRSYEANAIVPSKPTEAQAKEREAHPIEGAFVKIPKAGIYENIAVFDFRGLYPSIITSHNIDPFTLNCDCCTKEQSFVSPLGSRFCKKKKGLIPAVLEDIMAKRSKLKDELRPLQKDSEAYRTLFARVQALKIIANSYYGYLAYARSRWYAREAGESVTAWGRHYIQDTIAKASQEGFDVLYGDTDSIFLLLGKKGKEDALSFMKKINAALPSGMELELEGFFKRAVFVSKKAADAGAKKKYAMLGEDGKIKIRGFELVRRDWSSVAKDTQRRVLEAVLVHGSPQKAVNIVREVIERLRSGAVPLEELAISTQISKDPKKYEIISPEISAAKKAIARGSHIEKGSIISYIITKNGSTISEKAEILEHAKNYDASYYINHQVLPSVLKILKELGFSEDDLKFKGMQHGLGHFM
ncbi:hypothetical protein J4441_05760 [Candidatus Micrarchaeota archaeon]|nr:hypothetical protein [Candidatus Micrarchaeota archaeon]